MITKNFTLENGYTHFVTKQSRKIMAQCRFYKKCNVLFCPLDIYQVKGIFYIKGLCECKLSARRRKEIAKDYKELKYGGLNPNEWEKTRKWRKLPNDKKILINQGFKKGRSKVLVKVDQK
ncbi:hypothetical protein KKA66_02065 [Patescibacteria group bacterium]|nr:hypothetical protein [Patescibacteria group bacterium]